MKRYFNIIPGGDSCCILLYGEIGLGDGCDPGRIAQELYEAEKTYKKIDLRINSLGGSVYAGIALFNALHNSKADITIYVDGVAASIAAVVALCGKPLYMSRHARLMIHSVSGGCYGNKEDLMDCIENIEALETTLCAMCAKRLKKTEEQVRAEYFDGKDHWFTASEAVSLGFIDGVYDADPVPEESTPEQVYAIFQNRLSAPARNPQKEGSDMITKLKDIPRFANCSTFAEVLENVNAMEKEIESYRAWERENEENALRAVIDRAVKDRRIGEHQRETYTALLRADRTNGEAVLNGLRPQLRVMDCIDQTGVGKGSVKNRADWSLDDYRKHAPKELQRNPGLYRNLIEKEKESNKQP